MAITMHGQRLPICASSAVALTELSGSEHVLNDLWPCLYSRIRPTSKALLKSNLDFSVHRMPSNFRGRQSKVEIWQRRNKRPCAHAEDVLRCPSTLEVEVRKERNV